MPVGQLYQPPPRQLSSKFLDLDKARSGSPVKRNFVVQTKPRTIEIQVERGKLIR